MYLFLGVFVHTISFNISQYIPTYCTVVIQIPMTRNTTPVPGLLLPFVGRCTRGAVPGGGFATTDIPSLYEPHGSLESGDIPPAHLFFFLPSHDYLLNPSKTILIIESLCSLRITNINVFRPPECRNTHSQHPTLHNLVQTDPAP
jgi:hypothetical protein